MEPVEISVSLAMKINHWHAQHTGKPLTLSAAEVCELAGCDGGDMQDPDPDSLPGGPDYLK